MNKDMTYLICRASDEILFNIAKESINRYTPANILTCGKDITKHWVEAFRWLFDRCTTDIGVFIDDDAFILRDITLLLDLIRLGEYSMVGFTDRGTGKYKDFQYFQSNFMIFNIKKFKEEFGVAGIDVDMGLAKKELVGDSSPLFMYGISQKLRDRKNKDLSVRLSDKYKFASVISDDKMDYVLHLWYGAQKHRRVEVEGLDERDNKVSEDFWNNKLEI